MDSFRDEYRALQFYVHWRIICCVSQDGALAHPTTDATRTRPVASLSVPTADSASADTARLQNRDVQIQPSGAESELGNATARRNCAVCIAMGSGGFGVVFTGVTGAHDGSMRCGPGCILLGSVCDRCEGAGTGREWLNEGCDLVDARDGPRWRGVRPRKGRVVAAQKNGEAIRSTRALFRNAALMTQRDGGREESGARLHRGGVLSRSSD